MIKYINDNGGKAGFYDPAKPNIIIRPEWEYVDQYLRNEISLDDLKKKIGC